MSKGLKKFLSIGLGTVLIVLAGVGYYIRFFPVMTHDEWEVEVWAEDIPGVSALAHHPEGGLYATQENHAPDGTLLYVQKGGGSLLLLDGLNKPDGLALFQGGVVVSQEGGIAPVLWYDHGRHLQLFTAHAAEGMTTDGGRYLYAVEDRPEGRLLRYDANNHSVDVLFSGGTSLEGVAHCPDGSLYLADKKKGEVYKYLGEDDLEVVLSGLNKSSFLLCTDEGLWITEDATAHGRVLLYADGKLQTIARHLRSAQTIIADGPNRMLVAEQGRNRILALTRKSDDRTIK